MKVHQFVGKGVGLTLEYEEKPAGQAARLILTPRAEMRIGPQWAYRALSYNLLVPYKDKYARYNRIITRRKLFMNKGLIVERVDPCEELDISNKLSIYYPRNVMSPRPRVMEIVVGFNQYIMFSKDVQFVQDVYDDVKGLIDTNWLAIERTLLYQRPLPDDLERGSKVYLSNIKRHQGDRRILAD